MQIAIAGTGDVAKYLVEELARVGFAVVVLTRGGGGPRPWFDARAAAGALSLRATDYSEASLAGVLADCDGVVSAVQDGTMASVDLHLALLAACARSPRCHRLIPSEYIGDVRAFPDQPAFYAANHRPVRAALAAQQAVAWTLVCPGWLADYLVPARCRYVRDIGACHPVVFAGGGGGDRVESMTIPGTGDEPITCTAARDVAAAVARLFLLPATQPWPPVTFVSGEATTWNAVRAKLGVPAAAVRHTPVAQLEAVVAAGAAASSEDAIVEAEFGLWSTTGATRVPAEDVAAQRATLFSGLHFRTVDELLAAAKDLPEGEIL